MKKAILLCAFLLAGRHLPAQEGDHKEPQNQNLFWGTAGLGGSYGASSVHPAVSASLNWVKPNGWGLSAGIRYTQKTAHNRPADYIEKAQGFFGPTIPPQDDFTTYSLSAVRRRRLGRYKNTSFLLEAGGALVRIAEQHFSLVPQLSEYDSNYETVQTPRFMPGLHAAAGIAAAPFRGFGIGIQVWTNLNPVTPLAGLDFQLLFGRVR